MIYLPPPQPVLNKDIRISGDVEIHPTASLAPGVILQAVPGQRIVIGADVCIGMGAIVNASQGSVEIESGAILGSGVLIFGACKIGKNACIGTTVTIFQANIEAMIVIEPGSILGDDSRQVELDKQPKQQKETGNSQAKSDRGDTSTFQPQNNKSPNTKKSRIGKDGYYSPTQTRQAKAENTYNSAPQEELVSPAGDNTSTVSDTFSGQDTTSPWDDPFVTPEREATVSPSMPKDRDYNKNPVVGQVYINQLLVTLFPHNPDFGSKTKKLQ